MKTIALCAVALLVPFYSLAAMIGYGSSDAVLPPKDQELFYTGFDVGFQFATKGKKTLEYVMLDQVSDSSQLGAIHAAERLEKNGAIAIVGFPTSHEALLAAKVCADKGVIGIFIGASHTKLAEMGRYVNTTGPSTLTMAKGMLSFLSTTYDGMKGLIITNPGAAYSQNLESSIKVAARANSSVQIEYAYLDPKLKIRDTDLANLKSGRYAFISITSFPSDAKVLMEQLNSSGIDLPMIVNHTWLTGELDFVYRMISGKKTPIYGQQDWVPGSRSSMTFERELKKRFGKKPSLEIAYGFDLGVVVGETFNRIKGPVTRSSFEKAFRESRCFANTAVGRMCFGPNGGQVDRVLTMVRFAGTGFEPIGKKH